MTTSERKVERRILKALRPCVVMADCIERAKDYGTEFTRKDCEKCNRYTTE